ncbi:MAG: hypothetical protein HDQ88_06380 [Clostridia bacterium]|nr:hypothetical protein [Clostridia bacterium]
MVEYNECALRQLMRKWDLSGLSDYKFRKFIVGQSAEVSIKLGNIDIGSYRQDIFRWYLIHPYGCVDNFVKEFKNDLKLFGLNINLDFNDKTTLEKLIAGLQEQHVTVSVEEYKILLDRYYHRYRNLLAHKLNRGEEEKIKTLYLKIDKEKIREYYPSLTNALSQPGILTFDDYTLCTANLKNITDTLTTDIFHIIDWNKYDVSKMNHKQISKFLPNNPNRLRGSIRQYINAHYGPIADDGIVDILQNKFIHSNNG